MCYILTIIVITALSKYLVIDEEKKSDSFHLYPLMSISASIMLLSGVLFLLTYAAKKHFWFKYGVVCAKYK